MKKRSIFLIVVTFMSCSVEVDIPLDNDDTNQEPYVIPNDIQVPTLGLLRYPINIFGKEG